VTPAPAGRRVLAKLIDLAGLVLMRVAAASLLARWLGPEAEAVRWGSVVIAYGWFVCVDGLSSPGKWLMGLRCLDARTGRDCSVAQSVLRNLVFLPDFGRVLVRALAGPTQAAREAWLPLTGLLGFLGIALLVAEVRWMSSRADRRRLGDAMGDTRVVLKAGSPQPA
jgi:uncharacterized RDD family membrane protein YckC